MAMPNLKELAIIVPTILALLIACNLLEAAEPDVRFESSLYASVTYAPRSENTMASLKPWYGQQLTPAGRIDAVFGQFVSYGAKRGSGGPIRS